CNSFSDCFSSIDHRFIDDLPMCRSTLNTALDIMQDSFWILAARIIRCHVHIITVSCCDLAHERTLAAIAISAAAEYGKYPTFGEFLYRLQHVLQAVRRMSVIDQYEKLL